MDRSDVFISYRRMDVDFVKQLEAAFRQAGKEVWIDWEDILPGAVEFSDEIRRGIEGSDAFVAVLSPGYLDSTYCMDLELGYALELNKRIIPIVLIKFEDKPTPQSISHINWIYFTPHAGQTNDFAESFPKVLSAMETDFEYVREHTALLTRARRWQENDRNKDYLLKGSEVQKAESWLTKGMRLQPSPTELHTKFIQASNTAYVHGLRRVRTIGLIVAAIMTVLLIGAVYLGFEAQKQRDQAELNYQLALTQEAEAITQRNSAWNIRSLFLADLSQQRLNAGSPQDALLLGLESLEHFPEVFNYQSQLAMFDVLSSQVRETQYIPINYALEEPGHLQWGADEQWLLTWNANIAELYDLDDVTSQPIVFQHTTPLNGVKWSGDETMLLTWNNSPADCTENCQYLATIWDVTDPSAPLVTISHPQRVEGAAWNADDSEIVTWSNQIGGCERDCRREVMVWDLADLSQPVVVLSHVGEISGALFSANSQVIVSWDQLITRDEDGIESYRSNIYIWDMNAPQRPAYVIQGDNYDISAINGVSLSPDESQLMAWTTTGQTLIWDLEDLSAEPVRLPHETGVYGTDWHPDGQQVLVWLEQNQFIEAGVIEELGGYAEIWDLNNPDEETYKLDHDAFVYGAKLIPELDLVWTWGSDGYVLLWDLYSTSAPLVSLAHPTPVYDVAINAAGDRLLTRTLDGIYLWSFYSTEVPEFPQSEVVKVSPDQTMALMLPSVFYDDQIVPPILLDLNGAWQEAQLVGYDETTGESFNQDINNASAAWSPDSQIFAIAEYCDCADPLIYFFDRSDPLEPTLSLPGQYVMWQGDMLITWAGETVYAWDINAPDEPLFTLSIQGYGEQDVVLSENGERLLLLNDNYRNYTLWDVNNPTEPLLDVDSDSELFSTLSADGDHLLLRRQRTVTYYDLTQSTEPVGTFTTDVDIFSEQINVNATHAIVLSSNRGATRTMAEVWDLSDLSGPVLQRDATFAAWSPDGQRFALAAREGGVEVWNLADLTEPESTLLSDVVLEIYWYDNMHLLLTTSIDLGNTTEGLVYYWAIDMPDEPVFALPNVGLLNGAVIAPDGQHVLTWSANTVVHWWPLDIDLLIAAGERLVLRTFSAEQGAEFNLSQDELEATGQSDVAEDVIAQEFGEAGSRPALPNLPDLPKPSGPLGQSNQSGGD